MKEPIQIAFRGLQHSEALAQYVLAKAARLGRRDPFVTACRVALEAPPRHGHHGKPYRVRIGLTVPGAEILVTRAPGDDRRYQDLYAAIDAAFDQAGRRVQDFALRRRGGVKHHAKSV
jgi:ribosome-associated translation inhibitor RaiA